MSSLQPPSTGWRELDRSSTDLDGLMRAFFQAQMPESWPALTPPAASPLAPGAAGRRRSLGRSRLALAASLLLLLIGQFLVSGIFYGSSHLAAGDRGKTEAANRKLRSPKPASRVPKAEAIPAPGRDGMLISERR